MASISGNGYETRDKIKKTQEFLYQEIERVTDLKNLLSISEAKVAQLQRELAEYKATIDPTPINSCPPEILSMVFQLSVPEDGNIHHIGRLLLVCRRWHTLVMNDPQMWNNICICAPDQWDMRSWSKPTRLYVDSCIERSHTARLDIELDFSALRTIKQQVMERLHYGFLQLPDSTEVGVDRDLIGGWLENLDYEELERDEIMVSCLPWDAIHLIDRLIGVDGEFGQRWQSFALRFPSSQVLTRLIWGQLAPNTINLSCIHLIGFAWADLRLSDEDEDEDEDIPILSLPHVKDLRIGDLDGWDRFLSFNLSSLHKLSVNTSFEKEFFPQIARFEQLRTLTLMPSSPVEYIRLEKSLQNRIYLPLLQELALIGLFGNLEPVKFDLPRLKHLLIKEGFIYGFRECYLPVVQPLEVHWAIEYIPSWAKEGIRAFFLMYKNSDCFSIASFFKYSVLKVLKELSTEGVLPPRWKTVSFHDTSGGIETIHIDRIVSS